MKAFWNIENIDVILQSRLFLLIVSFDNGIAPESFSFKIIYVFRDITFLWFLFNVVFLTTLFSLSIRFVNITDILNVTLVISTDYCWHD